MTTKIYINNIKKTLPEINSIVEIQCGDGYEIENCHALQDKNLQYIGVDVRDEIILENRQYFRYDKNKIFITLDASNEPIPKADLILCVGMAEYLPIANIWSLLENIRESQAKYFAFDFYHNQFDEKTINQNLVLPQEAGNQSHNFKPERRPINLTSAPFCFPKPRFLLTQELNHSIAIYKIDEVAFFMDWHNDDLSELRMNLFKKLEESYSFLKESFDQETDGEKKLREMFYAFLTINSAEHNQKYYYDEPYKTIINRINGLETRNNIFRLVYRSEIQNLINNGYNFINEDNFINAQIITKDYIKWKLGLDFHQI